MVRYCGNWRNTEASKYLFIFGICGNKDSKEEVKLRSLYKEEVKVVAQDAVEEKTEGKEQTTESLSENEVEDVLEV